jgi:chromosome segregation ATPase
MGSATHQTPEDPDVVMDSFWSTHQQAMNTQIPDATPEKFKAERVFHQQQLQHVAATKDLQMQMAQLQTYENQIAEASMKIKAEELQAEAQKLQLQISSKNSKSEELQQMMMQQNQLMEAERSQYRRLQTESQQALDFQKSQAGAIQQHSQQMISTQQNLLSELQARVDALQSQNHQLSVEFNNRERDKIESDERWMEFEQNAEIERNQLTAKVRYLSLQLKEKNADSSTTAQHYRIASDADEDQDAQWRDSSVD